MSSLLPLWAVLSQAAASQALSPGPLPTGSGLRTRQSWAGRLRSRGAPALHAWPQAPSPLQVTGTRKEDSRCARRHWMQEGQQTVQLPHRSWPPGRYLAGSARGTPGHRLSASHHPATPVHQLQAWLRPLLPCACSHTQPLPGPLFSAYSPSALPNLRALHVPPSSGSSGQGPTPLPERPLHPARSPLSPSHRACVHSVPPARNASPLPCLHGQGPGQMSPPEGRLPGLPAPCTASSDTWTPPGKRGG